MADAELVTKPVPVFIERGLSPEEDFDRHHRFPIQARSPRYRKCINDLKAPILRCLKLRRVVAPRPIPALTRNCYPNPGYLGASSHVAIFDHLSSKENPLRVSSLTAEATSLPAFDSSLEFEGEIQAAKVSKCIKTLLQEFPLKGLIDLISFWRATGPNLSLAEPFVDLCYSAWDNSRAALPQDLAYARWLIQNSTHPLADGPSFTLEQYASQFLGPSTRLETVGLLFCAVIRAASEVNIFPSLYLTSDRRQTLLGLALNITNVAVEICLSMDRLNDLQLVLQYENFISHSFVFGVQCKSTQSCLARQHLIVMQPITPTVN